MNSYELLNLIRDGNSITLYSTDDNIIIQLSAGLSQLHPGTQMKPRETLTSGETYCWYVKIEKDQNTTAIFWWMIKQLCAHNWEPFQAFIDPVHWNFSTNHLLFRKQEED